MSINPDILGFGLRFPMTRGARDFQTSSGPDLVFSTVPYILETQANSPNIQGEIPWDSTFGSQLKRLKHKNIIVDDEALNELARDYVVEALLINEPRLLVLNVRAQFEAGVNGNRLEIFIEVAPIESDIESNDVRIQEAATIAIAFPV